MTQGRRDDCAPVYRATANPPIPKPRRRMGSTVDAVFVLLALGCAGWYAARLLLASFQLHWASFIPVIGFYAVVAYLLLPRAHQVFTALYVPDYFIGRTRTSDGLLGDPVNLAFDGSEADLHAAMRAAGWSMAHDMTFNSALRTIRSALFRRTYAEAPVSTLTLFGRPHDFCYQQEVGGDASRRHHVRFWRTPHGWLLPGGTKVDWLAAGTYDRSLGLSLFTGQITHKIDPDTDAERDYIVATLTYADPAIPVRVIDGFFTAYHARNGGGDAMHTDGDLPIVETTGADARLNHEKLPEVVEAGQSVTEHRVPPPSLLFAGLLCVLRAIQAVLLLPIALETLSSDGFGRGGMAVGAASLLLGALLYLALWGLTLTRRRWARTLFMVLLTADAVISLLQPVGYGGIRLIRLGAAALSVMTLLMVSGTAARLWVDAREKRSRDKNARRWQRARSRGSRLKDS